MIVFSQSQLPKKIVSDEGTNLISNKFKQFCRQLDVEQPLPYHTITGAMER